jgi:hypothetical protein
MAYWTLARRLGGVALAACEETYASKDVELASEKTG